jgi:hypothetical protein
MDPEHCIQPEYVSLAHLQVAGGVEKKVGWLEVSMENIRRVDVLQASQNLN